MIEVRDNKLIRRYDGEIIQVEAWGKDALRVRITKLNRFTDEDWALLPPEEVIPQIRFFSAETSEEKTVQANTAETIVGDSAEIINGKIRLKIAKNGKIIILNDKDEVLLGEYEYIEPTPLKINSRELKGMPGGNFAVSLKFEANPGEKLYGMGQYQDGVFDLKGSSLELAQRNTQASVPFVYSSLGYGFFWNNPAVGRATFGTNMTEWTARSTKQVDFWVTAGDSPAEILSKYMEATGKPPAMPEHGLGFWQSRLRYQTQEEVLSIARKYHELGIPLDVIIIDFFHWPVEGAWDFDHDYWPDPAAMVKELKEMGIRPMVSVWPTVSVKAPNYGEMKEKGYLVRTENGVGINMLMVDPTSFLDATNPQAREYAWQKVKETYVSYGITDFWLDVAEPEYSSPDFENYRYYKGNALEVANEFPARYASISTKAPKKKAWTPSLWSAAPGPAPSAMPPWYGPAISTPLSVP